MDDDEYVSRRDYDALAARYEQMEEALQAEIDAREGLQAEYNEALESVAELDDLRGKVRGRSHRDAFEKIAGEMGIDDDPAKRDDLYRLGDWSEEADEPDAKAMKAHFEPLLESRPWLKSGSASKPARLAPEDGAGRGSNPGSGRFTVRGSDLSNPDWMHANQDRYAAALGDGSLNLID